MRIVQMSDIHTGSPHFRPELLEAAIEETNAFAPDLVAVAGDLTTEGYLWEFEEAKRYLDRIECPNVVVIMGNHDAKNVGYRHFEDLFGARACSVTLSVPEGEAKVVALDSTMPDLSEGEVGREHYGWLDSELRGWDRGPKIVMVHHHILAVPGTGRDRNNLRDSGDVMAVLRELKVDMVLSGHRHVPYVWSISGVRVIHSGTVSSLRIRGIIAPSYNVIEFDSGKVLVTLRQPGGEEEPLARFSRQAVTTSEIYPGAGTLRSLRRSACTELMLTREVPITKNIGDLPHALTHSEQLDRHLAGRQLAVFLDYDGTLTPIVDRPEDAVISESMRNTVCELAQRCPVCVVSGRDREVAQKLMGIDDLIVAGSHGFDIWSPAGGTIQREEGAGFENLLDGVKKRLHEETASIEGALIEPKKTSVAAHFRLVSEEESPKIKEIVKEIVDTVLAEHPDELKVTPGKMVYEIQPKLDWDKGKAVLYLLEALDLGGDDAVPMYLGDDITDEHAFEALAGRGIGIFVGRADDPEVTGRTTAADYVLHTLEEVEQFLNTLAR